MGATLPCARLRTTSGDKSAEMTRALRRNDNRFKWQVSGAIAGGGVLSDF
jgi:hypothetical protein